MTKSSRDYSFLAGFAVMLVLATVFILLTRPRQQTPPRRPPDRLARVMDSLNLTKTRGSSTARDTLVEVTDFLCSGCAQAHDALEPILRRRVADGSLLHIVWELPFQRGATDVSVAASCVWVARKGDYWKYRETLFAAQRAIHAAYPAIDELVRLAHLTGLDSARVRNCYDAELELVTKRFETAVRTGFDARIPFTPVLWLNGTNHTVAELSVALNRVQ